MRLKWRKDWFWVLLPLAVGALSAALSREGTDAYSSGMVKPPMSPPTILFPIVWTVLSLMMGIGAAMVRKAKGKGSLAALNVFVIQLIVNFFWSLIFFNAQAYGFAFVWLVLLLVLVIAMTVLFYRQNKTAGLIQIPYVLWLVFAGYLNFGVWLLNG